MEASPPLQPPDATQSPQAPVGQWPQGNPPGYGVPAYDANGRPQPGPYAYGPPPKGSGLPGWAIALIVLAVVGPIMAGIVAAIAIPVFLNQHDKARDSSAREGAHALQIGIQTWAIDNGDRYPQPIDVSITGGLGDSMTDGGLEWPTNPWTDGPMGQGTGRGDFEYSVTADGTAFTLIMHLSGGQILELPY